MNSRLLLLPLVLLYAAGCTSTKVTPMASGGVDTTDNPATVPIESSVSAASLVGRYRTEIEVPDGKADEPGKALTKGLADMFGSMTELEVLENNRFRLAVVGMPIEGRVVIEGSSVTLFPETLMGMTEEELKKHPEAKKQSFSKEPMEATVEEDGQVIRLKGVEAQEGAMVFRRVKEEPKKPVADKVAPSDQMFVGEWSASVRPPNRELTEAEQQEMQMARALVATSTLELRKDYTFYFKMMLEFEGTWKITNSTLVLSPTKMMGMDTSGSKDAKPMEMKVEAGGKNLVMSEEPGKGALVYTKKS